MKKAWMGMSWYPVFLRQGLRSYIQLLVMRTRSHGIGHLLVMYGSLPQGCGS